jgi:predicted secreted protein
MRTLALASMMLGAALSSSAFAQDSNQLNYNIVNIQADASRQVANDQMQAVLYIEKSHKQPAELSNQINQLMNQAQALSRKYPQVKVETGAQSTYPIYDNDNNKLKEWRAVQKSK